MIHRAMFGSLERFTGILIENHAGHFPLWLAPMQAVVATIVSDADEYARDVRAKLNAAGLRAEADLRNEKINYKVREHSTGTRCRFFSSPANAKRKSAPSRSDGSARKSKRL